MGMINQTEINTICQAIYDKAIERYNHTRSPLTARLLHCQATIIYLYDYTLLKSYDTIVAVYYDSTVYDCLRTVYGYTATSAQHISKFKKIMGATRHIVAR